MLLAEQIVIDCPPRMLEDLLRHRPVEWLTPLLRLAGDEGEAAGLALLGDRARESEGDPSTDRRHHRAELGEATCAGGTFRAPLQWQTAEYRVLFGRLDGTISVRGLEGHSVVGIEGLAAGPVNVAARRAAECAVRSLLGHLRSAVEASPIPTR